MTIQTHFIEEPLLEFGNSQKLEHPQDGLFLYGPVAAQGSPEVIHVGIVGTQDGIELVTKWLTVLMRRLPVERPEQLHSSPWPGFSGRVRRPARNEAAGHDSALGQRHFERHSQDKSP